jgi:hypothetical protein
MTETSTMQVFPPSPVMSVELLPDDETILSMDDIFLVEQHTNHPSIPHYIAVQGSRIPPYIFVGPEYQPDETQDLIYKANQNIACGVMLTMFTTYHYGLTELLFHYFDHDTSLKYMYFSTKLVPLMNYLFPFRLSKEILFPHIVS